MYIHATRQSFLQKLSQHCFCIICGACKDNVATNEMDFLKGELLIENLHVSMPFIVVYILTVTCKRPHEWSMWHICITCDEIEIRRNDKGSHAIAIITIVPFFRIRRALEELRT